MLYKRFVVLFRYLHLHTQFGSQVCETRVDKSHTMKKVRLVESEGGIKFQNQTNTEKKTLYGNLQH